MKAAPILALGVVLIWASCAGASTRGIVAAEGVRARSAPNDLALVTSMDAMEEVLSGGPDGSPDSGSNDSAKMFALSFLLPGTGQLAQGEKRGYAYILAEIAFWAGFFALDKMGLDERDDYEDYADEEWQYAQYTAWYEEHCVGCEDCGYECRPLAEYGTQEYYEDIGKYQTYWRWWFDDGNEDHVDWDEYSSRDLEFRNDYWGMRDESNRHLRQARYLLMAAFLNHIVSGVDSFLSARSGGDEPEGSSDLGLEFNVPDNGEGLTCAIVARY